MNIAQKTNKKKKMKNSSYAVPVSFAFKNGILKPGRKKIASAKPLY